MANHSQVYRRGGDITIEEFTKGFDEINKKYFDGLLEIETIEENYFIIQPTKSRYDGICIEVRSDGFIEYSDDGTGNYDIETVISGSHLDIRHGHGSDFYWWLDMFISKMFVIMFDVELWDDGNITTKENMKNLNYRFSDYMKWKFTSPHDPNVFHQEIHDSSMERCKYLQEELDDKIYNTFVTEKYLKREEGVNAILGDERK
jgi:hypothetical protein